MNRKDVKKNCTLNIKSSATVSKGRNIKKTADHGFNIGKLFKASNNQERMTSLNILDSNKNTIDLTKSVLHTTEGDKAGDGTKIDIKISVNYSEKGEEKKKDKDKVKILELRKNNKSFNNLNTKNTLKTSKTLKSNISHKRNTSQADIIHNNLNISLFTYENNGKVNNYFKSPKKIINNNNSFAFNNQMLNRICHPCKTELNDENKIEEHNLEQSASREVIEDREKHALTLTQNHTLLTDQNQYSSKQKLEDVGRYFKNMNKKFDHVFSSKSFSSTQSSDTLLNHTNNINMKALFAELVNNNSVPESNVFFTKLNNCISELINNLMMQNNYIISQKNKELDNMKKKYNDISSKFIQNAITLEERNKEIKKLRERLKEVNVQNIENKKANYDTIENLISDEECHLTESVEIDNGKNKIITNINKENIDDLEAIYFYDKVHMRSNSENEFKVPRLNLNLAMEKVNIVNQKKIEENKKELKPFNSPGGKNAIKKKIQTIILSEKVNKNSFGFIKMNSKVDLLVNKVEKK